MYEKAEIAKWAEKLIITFFSAQVEEDGKDFYSLFESIVKNAARMEIDLHRLLALPDFFDAQIVSGALQCDEFTSDRKFGLHQIFWCLYITKEEIILMLNNAD